MKFFGRALFFISLVFIFSTSSVFAASKWAGLSQCKSYAEEVSHYLPQQLDAVTVWTNAECWPGGDGTIARFSYSLSIPENKAYPKFVKDVVYEGLINSWCTTPETREFLNSVIVEAVYSLSNGKYITSLRVSKDMC